MQSAKAGASAAGAGALWWALRHQTAPAVRNWRPGGGTRLHVGPLSVRVVRAREAPCAVLLLHGITASGDVFGAGYDGLADPAALVVPDLLGFGRSMAEPGTDFSRAGHLEALDHALDGLGLLDVPVTVAGHSMGALLALQWAAAHHRRGGTVRRVVSLCGPLYATPGEADRRISGLGPLEGLVALDHPAARALCAWMCAHRELASWLAVALAPRAPLPVARFGVRHTWPAYITAMNTVIRSAAWLPALDLLASAGVPVVLAEGDRDRIPVPGRALRLAARHPAAVSVRVRRGHVHDLPLADPAWCAEVIRGSG